MSTSTNDQIPPAPGQLERGHTPSSQHVLHIHTVQGDAGDTQEVLTQLPLFADPDVTAWWWNTHQHLPARVRLDIVTQTLPLCANEDSAGVLRAVQEDLQAFLKPVSAGQAALDNARELALEHPWFAGIALICLAGLLFKAGAALAGVLGGLASAVAK